MMAKTVLGRSACFCWNNASSIFILCLPFIVLDGLCRLIALTILNDDIVHLFSIFGMVPFYALYAPLMILLLDANHRNNPMRLREILRKSRSVYFKSLTLTILATLLIFLAIIGLSYGYAFFGLFRGHYVILGAIALYVIFIFWIAGKLAFTHIFLVLHDQTLFSATRQSFAISRGCVCRASIYGSLPGLLANFTAAKIQYIFNSSNDLLIDLMVYIGIVSVQLLSLVLLYNLYTMIIEKKLKPM